MLPFRLLFTLFASLNLALLSSNQTSLVSTESDPDAFIQGCVNIINGDYCETATDLMIFGPDPLVLQRFYSTKDPIIGKHATGWRMLPQRFLVIGKDSSGKICNIGKDLFEKALAFTGERSGGILPYSGWRKTNGITKDPLKIDVLDNAIGMVNTYAQEINGQTNHQNNLLHCTEDTCELVLGDGTKRTYLKVQQLPSLLLGEELIPLMSRQVIDPAYFLLSREILPSGNQICFYYDDGGHLTLVEMKNKSESKIFSWIRFSYEFQGSVCKVNVETSDERELTYHFILANGIYQLIELKGSHCIPIAYEYADALVKKTLPEGRFIEIDYQDGKVNSLKSPNQHTGKSETMYSFSYGNGFTEVLNSMEVKTRYIFDERFQLTDVERYDDKNQLYCIEKKYWGKNKSNAGLLLAKTIGDSNGRIHSYRSFQYDQSGNITEERLYGNLTGKEDVSLQVSIYGSLRTPDAECNIKTYDYSSDGFNLLTRVGDCKGNKTLYTYKSGSNLLIKKLIYDGEKIKKRTFRSYNEDAVCIKITEDDAYQEELKQYYDWGFTERHITEIQPNETLPGVGLPEIISEKVEDVKNNQIILINKIVNDHDAQSNLRSSSTYDANEEHVFTERRTYNAIGQVISQIDALGREHCFNYDGTGNRISTSIPQERKYVTTFFNFHNQPTEINEVTAEGQSITCNSYDSLGRKISSTDRFGNSTYYEYDAFDRLITLIHPEVLNENNQIIHPTFRYTYDIFGNALTTEDAKGYIVTKNYNLRGSPTQISYPDGSFELFKYDAEGSIHRSLTREQIITVYEYDYLGRIAYEEVSSANENGVASFIMSRARQYNGFRCTYEKDDDHIKKYTFDAAGRVTSIIEFASWQSEKNPESRFTEVFYDPVGRTNQKKIWFGTGPKDYALENFEYDLSGNITEKRIEDSEGNILLKKHFTYDLRGKCTEEYSLENGVKTSLIRTSYNCEGEPTLYLDASGHETRIIIDNCFLNSLGQCVVKKIIVNSIGVQTEIEFDALSRIYSIIKKDPYGLLLSSQRILYDSLGNKSCEINDQIVEGKVINVQKVCWKYGPLGRLEEVVEAADSTFEKRTFYSYNTSGKMISKAISGISNTIDYTYDINGKLEKIEARNGKKELQISNTYYYDFKGNILSAFSLNGKSVQKTYNAFNQVSQEKINDGEGSYILQYSYDKKGRLKDFILPDKSKISYDYDAVFGRKISRISAEGKVLYTHTYDQYDIQGRLQNETCIGGLSFKGNSYDINGRKISCKSDYFSEKYVRDSLGRLLEVISDKHEEFSYNSLSQLTSEKKDNTKTYQYDSLDNRIKTDNDELLYNTLNQLTSYSNASFTYDPQGNLLRKVLEGEETHFESNIFSQLTSIEKADKTMLTFSYDPFGRLLVEKELDTKDKNRKPLSTSRYFYHGYQEIGTLTKIGKIDTLKIPGLHGDELAPTSVAFEIKGKTYVPFHDIAGNVVSLVDFKNQKLIERYQYTAFGEEVIYNEYGELEKISAVGNPWRFSEKRKDQKSGLIFFGMRFYDPIIGRWISQDPATFIDGPNLYAYLHNNPLNNLDRCGLSTEANTQNKFEGYFFGEVEKHCYCEKHRTCKRGGDIGEAASSTLPKVIFFEEFEISFSKGYKGSKCFDLSKDNLPQLPNQLGIGFINGIWNDYKGAKESAHYISKLAGGHNIHGVFNATHGYIDFYECALGLDFISTEPVRQLHKMWDSFFEKSSANYLMICHSQGAIHVMNALLDYSPELRERILVLAIAPGGYIYKETCAKAIHYRAEWWRDFVPRIDGAGAIREKDSIFTLSSHPNSSFFQDHEFMSPTYRKEIRSHIIEYIETQGKQL